MFIRKIKRANGEVSIVLVEGYRLNGKVKQRTIEYLGTESQLTKNDPDAVNKLIEKYKNQESKKDAFVKLTINLAERISQTNLVRNYGYFYLEKMYEELGLRELSQAIGSSNKTRYSLDDCLKLLCFMRAMYPCSKKASIETGLDYFLTDYKIELPEIYKALSVLQENKEKFVRQMHERLKVSYGRNTEILYYDVTNYFFETDQADDFRKMGCSKEHRPQPIVQMGLFIDNQGLPVDYYLYKGNDPDCTALKPSFEQIKKHYGTERIIITADKGLNSGSDLGYILSKNNGYIVSQRIRGAKKSLIEEVMKDEGWKTFGDGSFELKEFVRTIEVKYPDNTKHEHNQKVVCIWSRKYEAKERHERENLLDKVAELAADPSKFKASCHKGMKKYIREMSVDELTGGVLDKVSTRTSLDEEKIAADEALDGYYLIVSSETELTASEILDKYRGLWRIEQSFRITKSDIKSRPVFFWTQEHIEAHFLTCFITLTMLRMLEIRLGRRYSARRIIYGLNSAIATELSKDIYQINRRDEVVDELDKLLSIEFNHRYAKAEDLNRYHSQIMKSMYTTP